jgi:PadR family transcriptional regulator PadR
MRHTVGPDPTLFDSLRLELRRGCLTLAVLAQLRSEHYGYTLRKALADLGLDIDEGTLYPLLRRLESQGLLESRWRLEESRPRRYYIISPAGQEVLAALKQEWNKMVATLAPLVAGSAAKKIGN